MLSLKALLIHKYDVGLDQFELKESVSLNDLISTNTLLLQSCCRACGIQLSDSCWERLLTKTDSFKLTSQPLTASDIISFNSRVKILRVEDPLARQLLNKVHELEGDHDSQALFLYRAYVPFARASPSTLYSDADFGHLLAYCQLLQQKGSTSSLSLSLLTRFLHQLPFVFPRPLQTRC